MEILGYTAVILISIIHVFMGVVASNVTRNIERVRMGRDPDAGTSLFPTVPTLQVIAFLATWGINQIFPNLGFYFIIVIFLIHFVSWKIKVNRLRQELEVLIKEREQARTTPN